MATAATAAAIPSQAKSVPWFAVEDVRAAGDSRGVVLTPAAPESEAMRALAAIGDKALQLVSIIGAAR